MKMKTVLKRHLETSISGYEITCVATSSDKTTLNDKTYH